MDKIPLELLYHILSYLTDDPVLPQLPLLNSKWRIAHKHIKNIDLDNLLSKEKRYNLQMVVSYFPCANSLILKTKNKNLYSIEEFTGRSTMKILLIDSNYMLPGLRDCPQLQTLIVSPSADNQSHASLPTRNIATILKYLPSLKFLQVHHPCIWDREIEFRSYPALARLRLLNLGRHFMDEFCVWLIAPQRFPNLEELFLDLEYATIPLNAIDSIFKSCPSIKTLKFRFSTVPIFVIDGICKNLKTLKCISFGQCKIFNYTNSWVDLFNSFLYSLPQLQSLHICDCELNIPENALTWPPELIHHQHIFPNMISFKAFDISHGKIGKEELNNLLLSFPNLQSIRCDVPSLFNIPSTFCKIQKIELRYSKLISNDDTSLSTPNEIEPKFENLKSLTLWSPMQFPVAIIRSSASNLVSISINYSLHGSVMNISNESDFCNLKNLEIRGISHAAQHDCITFLKYFLQL